MKTNGRTTKRGREKSISNLGESRSTFSGIPSVDATFCLPSAARSLPLPPCWFPRQPPLPSLSIADNKHTHSLSLSLSLSMSQPRPKNRSPKSSRPPSLATPRPTLPPTPPSLGLGPTGKTPPSPLWPRAAPLFRPSAPSSTRLPAAPTTSRTPTSASRRRGGPPSRTRAPARGRSEASEGPTRSGGRPGWEPLPGPQRRPPRSLGLLLPLLLLRPPLACSRLRRWPLRGGRSR